MAKYQDKNEWVDNVYTVDVFTPVLGGKTAWQGEHPVSGYSNASIEQLADRTHYLKEAIETLERVLGVKTDGIMLGKNNLSELTDIMEAKYRLELNLVDNVRDLDKPVSNPTRVELNKKADKATRILGNDGLVGGGDLSTNRNIGLSQATKDSLLLADNSVQKETRVIAGNGLTGGGSLSGDVTLNLGTPSETSVTSTNSSSGSSHTHALSAGVKDSLIKADNAAPLSYTNTELGKKADKTINISAGTGLSGGGNLSASRTISLNSSSIESLGKADSAVQPVAGHGLYPNVDKTKLAGIATGATKNATDAQLRDRTTHTGEQPISSVTGLQTALDGKVENNDPRLTNSREWTASVVSQAEAETGTATTARKWTAQRVRQAILGWWTSSPEKVKLDGVATGATKNATDAHLLSRSNHTGTQAISTVSGLQTALDSKVANTDSRLTNSREWTGATISQAEAEAGTATTRRAFTAQRVRQAIEAWWLSASTLFGRSLVGASDASDAKSKLGLSTVATSGSYNDLSNKPTIPTVPALMPQAEATTGTATTQRTINAKVLKGTIDASITTATAPLQPKLTAGSNVQISADNVISSTNTTYAGMSQAEASAGTVTAQRLISPKVLVDTISAAVSGGVSADALIKANNLSDVPNKTTARNNLGLGSAATRNVGESSGNVMEVGAYGLGKGFSSQVSLDDQDLRAGFYTATQGDTPYTGPNDVIVIPYRLSSEGRSYSTQLAMSHDADQIGFRRLTNGTFHPWREIYHAGNFDPTTKVDTSRQITAGNGLSGGGNFTANRTITLGTPSTLTGSTTNAVTATSHTHEITVTKADVGLSNVTNVAQAAAATQIIAGNGLSGGGAISANRTITLGTPSSLTKTATNSVSTTSHTHELGADVKASLDKADSALQAGDFGLGSNANSGTSVVDNQETRFLGWSSTIGQLGGMDLPTWGVGAFISRSSANAGIFVIDSNNGELSYAGKGSSTWKGLRTAWDNVNFDPDSKQDKLTAGTNVSISGNTISATNTTYTTGTLAQLNAGTDTSGRLQTAKLLNDWLNGKGYVTTDTKYSAGNGLTLSGTTFSLPVTVSGSGSYVQSVTQSATGLTVTLGTPPNTNTTYSAMSVAEIRAGTATTSRVMTAKNIDDFSSFVALSGTAITPNLNSGRNFSLSLTGNTTINNPTNLRSGQTGDIAITVGDTEHTLSFGSAWKFSGGNVPETKANSITVISYKVVDASTIICGVGTEVK